MEPFATLTCSRGDRPQFLQFCRRQIERFTIQPKHSIFVEEPPKDKEPDLTKRIRMGIVAARNLGIDIIYIIEDDDYYPPDYIEQHWIGSFAFLGRSKSLYYNIRNKTYAELPHPKRSSLYNTAFRISALQKFAWPEDNTIFLDLHLWKHAQQWPHLLMNEVLGVGIKHGTGLTAGIGHKIVMPNKDADSSFLRSKVDSEAFKFYQSL